VAHRCERLFPPSFLKWPNAVEIGSKFAATTRVAASRLLCSVLCIIGWGQGVE